MKYNPKVPSFIQVTSVKSYQSRYSLMDPLVPHNRCLVGPSVSLRAQHRRASRVYLVHISLTTSILQPQTT